MNTGQGAGEPLPTLHAPSWEVGLSRLVCLPGPVICYKGHGSPFAVKRGGTVQDIALTSN
jgi:hypothetical protein